MKRPIINQLDRWVARKYPKSLTAWIVQRDIAVLKIRREFDKLLSPFIMKLAILLVRLTNKCSKEKL